MLDIVLIGAGAMATEVLQHLKSDSNIRVIAAVVLPSETGRARELMPDGRS
jgi:predicted dinucleotide-utilizing enzyme